MKFRSHGVNSVDKNQTFLLKMSFRMNFTRVVVCTQSWNFYFPAVSSIFCFVCLIKLANNIFEVIRSKPSAIFKNTNGNLGEMMQWNFNVAIVLVVWWISKTLVLTMHNLATFFVSFWKRIWTSNPLVFRLWNKEHKFQWYIIVAVLVFRTLTVSHNEQVPLELKYFCGFDPDLLN